MLNALLAPGASQIHADEMLKQDFDDRKRDCDVNAVRGSVGRLVERFQAASRLERHSTMDI